MALNNADKKLIDEVSANLRVRFRNLVNHENVSEEDLGDRTLMVGGLNRSSVPVVITKDELRRNSGRDVARDAYLNEVASALNQKQGISACVDLDKGVVLAHAVPDTNFIDKPMTVAQLLADVSRLS